jgi:polyvinyl alcohol dehydrogenase (cytochrome)
MTDPKLTRRHLLAGAGALAGATTIGYFGATLAQNGTPVAVGNATPRAATPLATPAAQPATTAEWPFYGNTIEGTKFTNVSSIASGTVAGLKLAWNATVDGPISSTPVIAEGIAVIGSYDSKLRAYAPFSGELLWTYDTGANVTEPNLKIPIGITGSAAIRDNVVYTGDSAGKLHAIDAGTGEAIWAVKPNDQAAASIWSSPVIANGVIYVGIASVAKETGFRGLIVAVNASDGSKIWEHYVTPEGTDGGGVFAVPAIDLGRNLLFVGTQNAYSANATDFGNVTSILALDLTSGDLKWAFAGTRPGGKFGPADDVGFSASPNLFTAQINGQTRDLVGCGQKNGVFHVLDRDTGEVVWEETISSAGPLGGMEGTSAVGNGIIVIPATEWADFNSPNATGVVRGLDAATGSILWTKQTTAPNPAPVAIANDVAFQAGFEGVLRGLDLQSGGELFSFDLGASVSGGIAIADDLLILGAATPAIASFIKEGSQIWAFTLAPSGASTPVASPAASPAASPEAPVETSPTALVEQPTEPPAETSPVATPIQ